MKSHKQLWKDCEESCFSLLMEVWMEEEGKRILQANERLKRDPNAAVSEEVRRRGEELIRAAFGQRRNRAAGLPAGGSQKFW